MIFPYRDSMRLIEGDTGLVIGKEGMASYHAFFSNLERSLIFLTTHNRAEEAAAYAAALNNRHALCLIDGRMESDAIAQLAALYLPRYILGASVPALDAYVPAPLSVPGLSVLESREAHPQLLHPDLALLLSTSGTTGSPKMIRLSYNNLASNAASICGYLGIGPAERAIMSLPMHYSYGLSVLNSHLVSGATVVMTSKSILEGPFWEIFHRWDCTSLAAVPYSFEMLDRIGFAEMELPSLKTLTQAGGRLSPALALKFHAAMHKRGGRFFMMYGQTEATARIAYLPDEELPRHPDSIGRAIPGGKLTIDDHELVYEGPNVMMGYAESAADLAKVDELHGTLRTGDLGYQDEEGLFYLTGRAKRISKVYGQRINLDEVERAVQGESVVAAVTDDIKIYVYVQGKPTEVLKQAVGAFAHSCHLHPDTFEIRAIEKMPLKSNGKVDYARLL